MGRFLAVTRRLMDPNAAHAPFLRRARPCRVSTVRAFGRIRRYKVPIRRVKRTWAIGCRLKPKRARKTRLSALYRATKNAPAVLGVGAFCRIAGARIAGARIAGVSRHKKTPGQTPRRR
nr:MAG TPA: hypothetical protein [Caudoviricetes sp.]